MPIEKFQVPETVSKKRVDGYLASILSERYSRTKIKEWILKGGVTVNGQPVKPNFLLYPNQTIEVATEESEPVTTRAEKIPIEVVYEDKDILVVNKPAGLVVHPACGNLTGTLVNALLYHTKHLSKTGGDVRAGIVHRLDKDTSGLMVVAKNDEAHKVLSRQFKHHEIKKVYWVVVKGVAQHDEMRCEAPLGRSPANRRKITVQPEDGRASATNFRVLKRLKDATLLEACPETGRTHQIRVHLHHLHYPVLGDCIYGMPSLLIKRQALHAKSLSFVHPKTNKKLSFDSELPKDMQRLLKQLS